MGHVSTIEFIAGWWYTYPSEKYEFVSDDDIPDIWTVIKFMFQTTNQIDIHRYTSNFKQELSHYM